MTRVLPAPELALTVAALNPLARNGFLGNLREFVAELGASAVLSSHLLDDVARICDHLVVLAGARVQLAGDVPDLLAAHHRLLAPRDALDRLPAGVEVIGVEWADRHGVPHR